MFSCKLTLGTGGGGGNMTVNTALLCTGSSKDASFGQLQCFGVACMDSDRATM